MRPDLADPVVLTLSEQAGVHDAPVLAAAIAEALARNGPVSIDSSEMRQVDLATLQVLVAAHRQAALTSVPLQITVPDGGTLANALAAFGFLDAADARLSISDGLWTAVHAGTGQVQ